MDASSPPSSGLGWRRLGWLAGLPVLGLLWAGATSAAGPYLTGSLTQAAAQIVRETGRDMPEPWLGVSVEGRDLFTRGEAPDEGAHRAALVKLAALPGLRRVIDRTGLIELVSPFVWTLSRLSRDRVETAGSRPAEIGASAFASQIAAALGPGVALEDGARAARGASPDFLSAAVYAAERLRGLGPGAIATVSGQSIALRGEALDSDTYEAARSGLPTPPQGFGLGAVEILPPVVGDFRFVVERRVGGGMALSGFTVSEAARAEIRAMAEQATEGAPVEDGMRTARGLPDPVEPSALARFAIRLAGLLRDGKVRYEAGTVSVSGNALDAQAVDEAGAMMRDERPPGISAGGVSLAALPVSPYVVRIRRDGQSVSLTGHLPDRQARDALLAALRQRFSRETVVDKLRFSDGAPSELNAVLVAAIGPLSTLASGELLVSDRSIRLTGEGLYPESVARTPETLRRAMPQSWQTAVSVTTRGAPAGLDAQACQARFAERTGQPLHFASGSSELRPEFYPVLDALADLAKSCPAGRIEVTGHLDAPGTPPAKPAPLPEVKALQEAKKQESKSDGKKDKGGKDVKGPKPKPGTTQIASADPAAAAAEPDTDLATARARAIVEYLRKAGLTAAQAVPAPNATPLGERQGVGLSLRS